MNEELDPQDIVNTEALLHALADARENRCTDCSGVICGHEALMSLTMGFKDAPRCLRCLADALEQDREALRDHLYAFVASRSCYSEGWLWANQEEGFEPGTLPRCLWPAHPTDGDKRQPVRSFERKDETPMSKNDLRYHVTWDAGDMGCGDLVLELRTQLQALEPGQVLRVLATDPGAEKDLPSWRRMTGNTLLPSHPPLYLIKRKAT